MIIPFITPSQVTHVAELVIATRARTVSDEDYSAILQTARTLGVPFEDHKLSRVDWDKCKGVPQAAAAAAAVVPVDERL